MNLLTDKARLKEIYLLRAKAYENSFYGKLINTDLYPHGWTDFLDESSFHWVVEHDGKIIASARITVIAEFSDIVKLGAEIDETTLPDDRPFVLFSRLVVLQEYRKLGLSRQLDQIRILKWVETNLSFAIATCTDDRVSSLSKQGFKKVCPYVDKQLLEPEIINLLLIDKTYKDDS